MRQDQHSAPLREGFTTGTAAAAAARAAVRLLLALARAPGAASSFDPAATPPPEDTPLPPGHGRLPVPLARLAIEHGPRVRAVVVKDGGDDPDATHGAEIHAIAEFSPDAAAPGSPLPALEVLGGGGVGRVTLPGLPVPPGQPAINPAPMAQIRAAVAEVTAEARTEAFTLPGLPPGNADAPDAARPGLPPLRLTIEVPDGEAIARKTMNERLGILGGISILGTAGIVRPYSHDAWLASVEQALAIARASSLPHAVLTTGRRTERFHAAAFPGTPPLSIIQAADFFAASTRAAARLGFHTLTWALFFGKLVKQAQGFPSTHAHAAAIDFPALAADCRAAGLPPGLADRAATANTAMEVQTLAAAHPCAPALYRLLAAKALAHARAFAAEAAPGALPGGVFLALYGMEGELLLHAGE